MRKYQAEVEKEGWIVCADEMTKSAHLGKWLVFVAPCSNVIYFQALLWFFFNSLYIKCKIH